MKKETKTENKDWRNILVDLEKKLNGIFGEKAPKLPESVVNFLVNYGPYLVILGIIIGAGSLLTSLGLMAVIMPLARMEYYGYHYGFAFWNLFSLAAMVLEAIAIPGLFKKTKQSWNLMFYASLAYILFSLFSSNLISAAIGAIVSWYFLFQIRKSYK